MSATRSSARSASSNERARRDGAERGVPDDIVCVTAADRERDPFGEDQAVRQLEVAAHPLLVDLEPVSASPIAEAAPPV